MKFKRKDHGSINDSGAKNLPVGEHGYTILKVEIVPVKADKSGKRKHISVSLRHTDGKNYTFYIEVNKRNLGTKATAKAKENEKIRQEIAYETFGALMEGAGFDEDFEMTPAKFKLFTDKDVVITSDEVKKGENTYSRILSIYPADEEEGAEEDEDYDEDEDSEDEAEYDEEESDEEEEEDYDEDEDEDEEEEDEDEEEEDEDEEEEEEPEPKPAPKKRKPAAKKAAKKAPRKRKPAPPADDEDEDDDPF